MIEPISDYASIYCHLDSHSESSPDTFYGVNNLYFDTPNYQFLINRLTKAEKRFNMRIRSYGANPTYPYFYEIKLKQSGVMKKFRSKILDDSWSHLLQNPGYEAPSNNNESDFDRQNRELFLRLAETYNIEPKVFTQYKRRAFISNCEEYARVTFDKELRYMEEYGYTLTPVEERMIPCDFSTNFDDGCNVILELKCYTSFVPLWMIDLIRTFDLRRRSFSKYITGVQEVIGFESFENNFAGHYDFN